MNDAEMVDPFGLTEFPYRYRQLSPRCGAFIEPLGLSNVGVIEADEGFVLIDSTIHPYFMAKILEELAPRTATKPILHLVNTHFHRDHTFGNDRVKPTRGILAHRRTADYQRRYLPGWLAGLDATYRDAVSLVAPDSLFDGTHYVVPDLSVRVEIFQTGGHTHDSCLVLVPSEGVVFSGDTVFNRVPPYLAHWSCVNHFGKLTDWISALTLIERELAPAIIVPGHGEVATRDDVDGLKRFFEYYVTLVEDGIRQGKRLRDIWREIQATSNFQRRELEADIYLHMTMALHDELTGKARELYDK